jgi:hypothetical protein
VIDTDLRRPERDGSPPPGRDLSLPLGTAALAVQQDTTTRRVDGRVTTGAREGVTPVRNQWVVLHRVGRDRAGPLDSTRTGTDGTYHFRYHASGDTTALYFVSTTYGGVAYFTSPLRAEVVGGDDAALTVFDTTSGPVAIQVAGRHLVVGSPNPNGNRPIGEVFDLQNDSTVTAIARNDSSPVWTTHIPASAVNFQLNARGDLTDEAISRSGSTVGLLVPISPGIRQIAFTYELPQSAFPLSVPMERPTGVFELLVQEPTARVSGVPLRETPAQAIEGRTFRRFLAQDLAASSVLRVEVPRVVGAEREKVYIGVATVLLAGMAAALVLTARRAFSGARRAAVAPVVERRSERLLREIAALDAEFERVGDGARRAAYDKRRNALKAELSTALAEERRRPR